MNKLRHVNGGVSTAAAQALPLLLTFLILLFTAAGMVHADEEMEFSDISVTGSAVTPSQQGLVLLELRVRNRGESDYFLSGLTLSYTGTASTDIADTSVKVFGSWDQDTWAQYGTGQSFSGNSCSFSGLGMLIPNKQNRYIRIVADCSAGAAPGNSIDADIASLADFLVTAPSKSGREPFHSLSPLYTVQSSAVGISITGVPASVVVGQSFAFTVSYVDAGGAVDPSCAGGALTIGGTPGLEPGSSPSGRAPEYSAATVVAGQSACTATLFSAQTGRGITATDSIYGSNSSPLITVTAAAATQVTMDTVGDQTAGVPFIVTLNTSDIYGNPSSNGAGAVTTVDAAAGIVPSPGGQSPNLPVSYTWSGGESGRAAVSVIIYGQSAAAQLKTTDTVLGGSVSNTFAVHPGAPSGYVLAADASVHLRTPVTITASTRDAWGNTGGSYAGRALVQCTDNSAVIPSAVSFSGGVAGITALFHTGGPRTVTLTDESSPSLTGSITMNVDQPPIPSLFKMEMPEAIEGGKPFIFSVTALDEGGIVIPEYNSSVNISVVEGAEVAPSSVRLSSGTWQGMLKVSGETFLATLCVSDNDVRFVSNVRIKVTVLGYEKTRAYPTVFSPRDGPLRIRYYLKEDRDVAITVYNLLMEPVRELRFSAGAAGGLSGLNVAEWDGRGGSSNGNGIGHSGGYHIIIDKGYEKDRIGAVIKNY